MFRVQHRRDWARLLLSGVSGRWGENVGCRLCLQTAAYIAEIRVTTKLEAFAEVHAACYDTSGIADLCSICRAVCLGRKMEGI